jgi:hypothetical protein
MGAASWLPRSDLDLPCLIRTCSGCPVQVKVAGWEKASSSAVVSSWVLTAPFSNLEGVQLRSRPATLAGHGALCWVLSAHSPELPFPRWGGPLGWEPPRES